MKFSVALNTLTVFREQGDKRFNSGSQFLYAVKKNLLSAGIPVIKKRMWKDGHLTADTETYLRSPRSRSEPTFHIYYPDYQISEASADWNQNRVVFLTVDFGYCSYWKTGDVAHHRDVFCDLLTKAGLMKQ